MQNLQPNLLRLPVTALLLCMFAAGCAETPIKPNADNVLTTNQKPAVQRVAKHPHSFCRAPDANTLASVVRVATMEAGGGDASGVVVAPNVVLTAAHVLEGNNVGLVYIGSQYKKAHVLGTDHASDIALLAVGTEGIRPSKISGSGLIQNELVWAVGFPLAQHKTITKGAYFRNRHGGLLTSASIDAGSSGGGLFHCANGQFELAGMVRSYMAYYRQGEQIRLPQRSISVPADTINAFILLHGIRL